MSTTDDLARVLDIILVDCYGEDEEYTAFLTVLYGPVGGATGRRDRAS